MIKRLVKPMAILAALAVLGVLFVRSAQNARAETYTIESGDLVGWTLALDPDRGATGTVLGLQAPAGLDRDLFNQVFSRAMETFLSPAVSFIPIVLRAEFDRALAGSMTAGELLAAARKAGIETARLQPACMGWRRDSQPGAARQVYFVLFEATAIKAFRQQLADAAGGSFDPDAVSPTFFVAAGDSTFASWMPLRADQTDCLAPVTTD
jgi:hypothetical protein